MTPYEHLESIAARVNSSNTESILALTDTVLAFRHGFEISQALIGIFQPKVEVAEVAYWQGTYPGVKEGSVVEAVNELTTALNLPEHARTTQTQVHEIRMGVFFTNPRLMGLRFEMSNASSMVQMAETMSPVQAIHLLLSIADLKFTISEYQLTPAEWEIAHAARQASTSAAREGRVRSNNNPRTHEIYGGLRDSLANLSDSDGIAIVEKPLRHLGID